MNFVDKYKKSFSILILIQYLHNISEKIYSPTKNIIYLTNYETEG